MIHCLRQRHRHVFAILVVVLPGVFAVGVAARKPVPAIDSLPAALSSKAVAFNAAIWSRDDLFSKIPIRTVLLRERANAGMFAVRLVVPATFAKPDLLVYWSAGSVEGANKIPDDAILLGTFNASGALQLPTDRSSALGTLILYSLADGEIVDVSKPISPQ